MYQIAGLPLATISEPQAAQPEIWAEMDCIGIGTATAILQMLKTIFKKLKWKT